MIRFLRVFSTLTILFLVVGAPFCGEKQQPQGTVNVGNSGMPAIEVSLKPINDDGSVDANFLVQSGDIDDITFSVSVRGVLVQIEVPLTTVQLLNFSAVESIEGTRLEKLGSDESSSQGLSLSNNGRLFSYQIPASAHVKDGDLIRFEFQKPEVTSVAYQGNASEKQTRTLVNDTSHIGSIGSQAFTLAQLIQKDDNDADGQPESTTITDYDAFGRIVRKSIDHGSDGIADSIETMHYDIEGNITHQEEDYNNDKDIDSVTRMYYDSFGDMTRREVDHDNDGVVDAMTIMKYDYDGNIKEEREDFDNDGEIDSVVKMDYDSLNRMIRKKEDRDNDGFVEQITTMNYDIHGNLVRQKTQKGDDRSLLLVIRFYYNRSGALFKEERDNFADGKIDLVLFYGYRYHSETGERVLSSIVYDFENNGSIDKMIRFSGSYH